MSRRKRRKQKSKVQMTHHSSLNPEFDEANAVILADIEAKSKAKFADGLVCETCGAVYEFDNHNKPGYYCSQKYGTQFCNGKIYTEKNVIKLPNSVKTGKKEYQNNGTGYYTGATTWESHKHYGDTVVFEFEGKQLFGSNAHSIDEKSGKWGLIIDLAGGVSIPKASAFIRDDMPKRFRALKPHLDKDETLPSEVLRLFWSDMGVPPAGIEFWLAMWPLLPEKTVIICQGGHGRTGTAIASLMIAAGVDYYSALADVRSKHCVKAVETLGQEQYLHAIYLENLNRLLKIAKAENNLAEVKDLVEDIEFAVKHKPSFQFKDDKKPVTSLVVSNDTKKAEGHNQSKIPFAESVAGQFGGNGVEEFEDPDGTKFKMQGEHIYVQECGNVQCADPLCKEPAHMKWVPWDYTEAEVW